jgi:acyl-CoA carboxylase epsilon subunit
MTSVDPTRAPTLSVVRGRPTDAELAALIGALLAALSPGAAEVAPTPAPRGRWADRSPGWHRLPRSGPSSWRASARPR